MHFQAEDIYIKYDADEIIDNFYTQMTQASMQFYRVDYSTSIQHCPDITIQDNKWHMHNLKLMCLHLMPTIWPVSQ